MDFPKRFLFRFSIPCRRLDRFQVGKTVALDESYQIPWLFELERSGVASPDSKQNNPPDLRIGWHPDGLALSLIVSGKSQRPWCRPIHPEESDGLHLCLDTRDVRDVHRATRFCHRLVFLPSGHGVGQNEPTTIWLPIHRAKGHPNPIAVDRIKLASHQAASGYQLDISIPANTLTGYDPEEHPNLGFHFAVMDRELGNRFFLVDPPFPHDQDPSLWGTLELRREM